MNSAAQTALAFSVAGTPLALPVAAVREIVPLPALVRPPGLPSFAAGFFDLGGEAVPVLRLGELIGLPAQELGVGTHLILVVPGTRGGGRCWALPADEVSDVLPAADAGPIPDEETFNGCASHLVRMGGKTYHLLRPEGVLLEVEERRLAEFQEREQARLSALGDNGCRT